MAKLKYGINGFITGRIGNIVYYPLNGEQIMRSIGAHSGEYTEAQLANQQRTKVVSDFLRPIKAFIGLSFKSQEFKAKNYAYNKATSYHKINATQGEYPNISIDFSKVRISEGDLPMAQNCNAAVVKGGVKFTWDFDDRADWARQEDQVMMMAYLPKQRTAYFIYSGARRTEREAILAIDPFYLGEEVETYMAFVSDDRTQISRSVYTGKVVYGVISSEAKQSTVLASPEEIASERNVPRNDDKQARNDEKQVRNDEKQARNSTVTVLSGEQKEAKKSETSLEVSADTSPEPPS